LWRRPRPAARSEPPCTRQRCSSRRRALPSRAGASRPRRRTLPRRDAVRHGSAVAPDVDPHLCLHSIVTRFGVEAIASAHRRLDRHLLRVAGDPPPPILIETRITDDVHHTGEVLNGSLIGESGFCPGGKTSGGSTGPTILTTFHCPVSRLQIRFSRPSHRSIDMSESSLACGYGVKAPKKRGCRRAIADVDLAGWWPRMRGHPPSTR
jgi:hypothetical protein